MYRYMDKYEIKRVVHSFIYFRNQISGLFQVASFLTHFFHDIFAASLQAFFKPVAKPPIPGAWPGAW